MIALTPEQRQSIERKFRDLASQWAELTAYRSNMGGLLCELERKPSASWFGLLAAITGIDPVPAELAGNVDAMAGAWLDWGRRQGYQVRIGVSLFLVRIGVSLFFA